MNHTAVSQIVISVASTLTAAGILWLAGSIRRVGRRLKKEHDWLMETTKQNTEEIARLLKVLETQSRGRR